MLNVPVIFFFIYLQLVPFNPVDIFRMAELFIKATFADGGASYLDVL